MPGPSGDPDVARAEDLDELHLLLFALACRPFDDAGEAEDGDQQT